MTCLNCRHFNIPAANLLSSQVHEQSRHLAVPLRTVTTEGPSQGKFTQLVPNHFFRHIDIDVRPAIVNQERVTDEFW